MYYNNVMQSVAVFFENRLESGFEYDELEKAIGFSLPHIRSVFNKVAGVSLTRYFLNRRISHAAFDIVHSDENILDISVKYGFENPDTFTRAFKRIIGVTPKEFRKERRPVGRIKLCAGVFGVSERTESMDNNKTASTGSTVLYGVPKVGYGVYGCTPYPICLKGAANYLGEDVDYDFVMVSGSTAFRLAWNENYWDGGNVDVANTFDNPIDVYKNGIEALGREFKLLIREKCFSDIDMSGYTSVVPNSSKEDFIELIKEQIDKGYPCIGLGFIGPPEACLITGYRDDGKTLLGWNFFQSFPGYSNGIKIDDSGYFITSTWWENKDTIAVISIGEKVSEAISLKKLTQNAVTVMSSRRNGGSAKGLMAYDAWKKAITDESQFPQNPILPLIMERLMCQGDAMDCLADGRGNAAKYFKKLSEAHPEQPLFYEIAEKFQAVADYACSMSKILGGWQRDEKQLYAFSETKNRLKIAELIDKCKSADEEALRLLKELEQSL